ncbi:sperm axonemal maintenance protein CFAP97D1-like [Latimeria chalumnae]
MHRAYDPLLPASNKYLQKKWDWARYRDHRRRVETAAPMVDTKGSRTPAHHLINLKKLQLEDTRLTVVERDNRLLSSNLATIMRSKGLVDHRNNYTQKSLNVEKRHRELQHISRENWAMLERVTNTKSEYRRERWEQDWERMERIRNDLTRYPREVKTCQILKKVHIQEERNQTETSVTLSRESERTDGSNDAECVHSSSDL